MNFWPLLLSVGLALTIETSLGRALEIGGASPDLLLLATLAWLYNRPTEASCWVAAGVGLLADLASSGPIGPGMACFALVAYVVLEFHTRLSLNHPLAQVVATGLFATATSFGLAMAASISGQTALPYEWLVSRAATVGLLTAGIGVPCFLALAWLRAARGFGIRRLA
jgi:rod shape-determining protein MreD